METLGRKNIWETLSMLIGHSGFPGDYLSCLQKLKHRKYKNEQKRYQKWITEIEKDAERRWQASAWGLHKEGKSSNLGVKDSSLDLCPWQKTRGWQKWNGGGIVKMSQGVLVTVVWAVAKSAGLWTGEMYSGWERKSSECHEAWKSINICRGALFCQCS